MTIGKIREKLEKLKTTSEKLAFLKAQLKEAKQPELKLFILTEITSLNLDEEQPDIKQSQLEDVAVSEREISMLTTPFQPEQQQVLQQVRQRSLESELASTPLTQATEAKQLDYGDTYGIKFSQNYGLFGVQGFESLSSRGSTFASEMRDRFIREGILSQERETTLDDRSSVRNRLRSLFPGSAEEAILRYEGEILAAKNPTGIYQKKIT